MELDTLKNYSLPSSPVYPIANVVKMTSGKKSDTFNIPSIW